MHQEPTWSWPLKTLGCWKINKYLFHCKWQAYKASLFWGGRGSHENINTAQIRLTHLFLLNSVIAPVDLIGLNWWIFGAWIVFLVKQDCHPFVDLKILYGVVWVNFGVGEIIFSLFLSVSLYPSNHHHSHWKLWVGSYLFCSDGTQDSHRKGPKIIFKVNLVDQKWTISHKREVTRRWENEISQSQGLIPVTWQQQNIEEACGGKMLQKQKKNKTLHTDLRHLETIKNDKTYINRLLWMWQRRCHAVWKK